MDIKRQAWDWCMFNKDTAHAVVRLLGNVALLPTLPIQLVKHGLTNGGPRKSHVLLRLKILTSTSSFFAFWFV